MAAKNYKRTNSGLSKSSVNYSLDNPKITFKFLKSHFWNTDDILRGSQDTREYRQPVMTLLYLKRLNETFESVGNLRKFLIFVPSIKEQMRISSHITIAYRDLTIVKKYFKKLKELKKVLMQQLLTGKIRVKV